MNKKYHNARLTIEQIPHLLTLGDVASYHAWTLGEDRAGEARHHCIDACAFEFWQRRRFQITRRSERFFWKLSLRLSTTIVRSSGDRAHVLSSRGHRRKVERIEVSDVLERIEAQNFFGWTFFLIILLNNVLFANQPFHLLVLSSA